MPKEQEEALKRVAAQRGYKGERADRFVYGTMRNQGWKPEREKHKEKGKLPVPKKYGPKKRG